MKEVLHELRRLQRLTRAVMIVQRAAAVLAWTIAIVLLAGCVDYLLRLPPAVRLVLLLAGLAAFAAACRRYFLPALAFRPTLTQMALRVERSVPSLRHRLASSVEFVLAGLDASNPLAARSVRDTRSRLAGRSFLRRVRPTRLTRSVAALLIIAAVTLSFTLVIPSFTRIGLTRLLFPVGSAQWPARTAVASLMHEVLEHDRVYQRGRALPLRARNLTPHAQDGRVDAHYHLMRAGVFEAWQTVVLTHQGAGVHERLVDANARAIEMFFSTEDARTATERVELVPLPVVVRATLRVTPPPYAADIFPPAVYEIGSGTDARAVADHAGLVGSAACLTLTLNKPLPVPLVPDARETWRRRTFRWSDDETMSFDALPGDADTPRWRLSWQLGASRELAVHLVDEHGLTNDEPIRYRIEAVPDRPPTVAITAPQTDQSVLSSAVIPIVAEAGDDVALRRVGLRSRLQRHGNPDSDDLPFAPQQVISSRTGNITAEMDLSRFDLHVGDHVLLDAFAEDGFVLAGRPREPVTSPPRSLRIIDATEFAAQIRRDLAAVRENAIRVDALQGELRDELPAGRSVVRFGRAQARISGRIAGQRDLVDALTQRVDANRLSDDQLAELLRRSRLLLNDAGRASNRAADAIEQWRRAAERPLPADSGPLHLPVIHAQQAVRDRLADLIELLGRDEDAWVVQRRLDSLIRDLSAVREQTVRLIPDAIGKTRDDLTPSQVAELDEIVRRQLDLRDRARALLEEMRRRADAVRQSDPATASALRSAARAGERGEVDRDLELAARRAEQTQLQSALAAQQAAGKTLQSMRETLQQTKTARAEELLRLLADLVQSITQLILAQEHELDMLESAVARQDYAGRDHAMIRLSRNTRSVASQARAASRQADHVARALDHAAAAQDRAVSGLRARPVQSEHAQHAEQQSLEFLRDARRLADELRQKIRQDRVLQRRADIIDAYRRLAESQNAIRQRTLPSLDQRTFTRRRVLELRRLGDEQNEIRAGLREIESDARELTRSEIFSYVHRLIDQWAAEVADVLYIPRVDIRVTDRQQMIADALDRQIEALAGMISPPGEFAQEGGPARGGGKAAGPPPLILPVAELTRLYGLQEQLHLETRSIDQRADLAPDQRRDRLRELARVQRDLMRITGNIMKNLKPPPSNEIPSPDQTN